MAAPTTKADERVKIWRKDLIGTAPDAAGAFEQVHRELFGDAVIALGSPANREFHGTFEFEASGHVFTIEVRPS